MINHQHQQHYYDQQQYDDHYHQHHHNASVELNNHAIAALEQHGDIIKAYELLVLSCTKMRKKSHRHDLDNKFAAEYYRFAWKDCTNAINQKLQEESSTSSISIRDDTSSTAFMYLRFLTIDIPSEATAAAAAEAEVIEEETSEKALGSLSASATAIMKPRVRYSPSCPCGYAWAVWYNLGIVSALMASLQRHPTDRRKLLEQALEMFSRAESRVNKEPPSKHWSLLILSILNNQACVLRDLSLDDHILERLVTMGLTLTKNMTILNDSDQEPFVWTIQLLMQDKYAPAA